MDAPIRLLPSLRPKVWGRRRLEPFFGDAEQPVGEAWFLTDQVLRLLVKFIFTSDRLSVQVHPADGEDGPRGKTEMWYILDAEPGASIALGFREPLTRARLEEASRSGEIEQLLNWVPVKAGETYFTPAHTVHSIGAGIVLCEIQQNNDLTYRLWDYGRPRELHVEKAVAIADLSPHPGAAVPRLLGEGREELVRCPYFVTERVRLPAGGTITPEVRACQIWICLAGEASIGSESMSPGDVWLLPDAGSQPGIRAAADTTFLRTWVPEPPL